jgi:hypothetical protein
MYMVRDLEGMHQLGSEGSCKGDVIASHVY